jgi:hypothetical protein
MNKHVRAVHGANKKRRGGMLAAIEAVEDDLPTAIRDLAKDGDLEEVVLRVRAKNRHRIEAETRDEEASLRYVRARRPGAGRKRRSRKHDGGSDSDPFDEGASARYPITRTVEAHFYDEKTEADVPVMSRSRWQAKYIMAKAKLMLVDEENKMRRDELAFWEALYESRIGKGEEGESDRGEEHERERERERKQERPRSRQARDPIEDMLSDEDIKESARE